MKKKLSLVLLTTLSSVFCSQSSFSGKAYNEKGEHIFTEEYVVTTDDQDVKNITTKFFDPKGSLIAELCSTFEDKSYLPTVKFEKEELPFAYGSSILEKSIEIFKSTKKRPHLSKKLTISDNMVVGHGFYTFILSKIDTLLSGKDEKMVFLQPNKLTSYTFSMKAEKNTDDKDIVDVTLTIDNKLLKAFVSDIKLCIHKPTQQVLSYDGISGFLPDFSSSKKVSIKYTTPKKL